MGSRWGVNQPGVDGTAALSSQLHSLRTHSPRATHLTPQHVNGQGEPEGKQMMLPAAQHPFLDAKRDAQLKVRRCGLQEGVAGFVRLQAGGCQVRQATKFRLPTQIASYTSSVT